MDVTFDSGGERCAAWLYRPDGAEPHPCVVMAGGLGAVRQMRLDAYAGRFADAGFAVLLFDYRHWGESAGEPRQLICVKRQLEDWRAALAYARDLDGIDAERVALWGTSFSGGHVIELAAEQAEVAAVVAQSPFTDGPAAMRAVPTKTLLRSLPDIVIDSVKGALGREPQYLPLHGRPGTKAALAAPEADDGYRALVPPDAPWENKHTPRFGLTLARYRPGKKAGRTRCPLLICVCEHDQTTPPGPAIEAAEHAPHGELRRYPIGHFEIYWGDHFEHAVSDQLDFLERHVVGKQEGAAQLAGP